MNILQEPLPSETGITSDNVVRGNATAGIHDVEVLCDLSSAIINPDQLRQVSLHLSI